MLRITKNIRDCVAKLDAEIESGFITPDVTAEEIRQFLAAHYDFSRPIDLEEIVDGVEQMLLKWQVQVTHTRYFGLFNPSVAAASAVAEMLVAAYNPQLASWRTSPAANEIERYTLNWLAEKFGMPAAAHATFTSGGSEANHSAVIVALTHGFPEYGEEGLHGLRSQPTIYLTAEAHQSFSKIAHMTGLGRRALRFIATTSDLRMDLADLELRIVEDRHNGFNPLMVVATAGTTSSGVIDPLPELGHFCCERGLWFHVDAAWGGAAILSPRLKQFLIGIELADSVTCDAHKWFSVSMGCGMFFCRHTESVRQSFRAQTSYMPTQLGVIPDPYTTSMQWSRRFIGLKLFLSLAERGEPGYAAMIEHQAAMGELLRESLLASGWQILNATPLPVVCFKREGLDIPAFLDSLRRSQIAWMSETKISGIPAIRACVTSYKTRKGDVLWVVDEINRLLPAHILQASARTQI